MKFSEIANRLTGISTPFGGASWQPAEMEIAAARRVIAFLEDRHVLYEPSEMEVPSHCVHSVIGIRHRLRTGWLLSYPPMPRPTPPTMIVCSAVCISEPASRVPVGAASQRLEDDTSSPTGY